MDFKQLNKYMSPQAVIDDLINGVLTDTHVDLSKVEDSRIHNQLVFRHIELLKTINSLYTEKHITAEVESIPEQQTRFKNIRPTPKFNKMIKQLEKENRKRNQPRIFEQIPNKLTVAIIVGLVVWLGKSLLQYFFPEFSEQVETYIVSLIESYL